MGFDLLEYARHRALWASVLKVAVDDIINCTVNKRTSRVLFSDKAIGWVWRTDMDASKHGSFCWVCSMLDMDPDRVRQAIKKQLVERKRTFILERIKGVYGG